MVRRGAGADGKGEILGRAQLVAIAVAVATVARALRGEASRLDVVTQVLVNSFGDDELAVYVRRSGEPERFSCGHFVDPEARSGQDAHDVAGDRRAAGWQGDAEG